MEIDFNTYFERYEALVAKADAAFEAVREKFPDCVTCRPECADCCHALFDLSLIEAVYLNHRFNETYKGADREAILAKANTIDRKLVQIKRDAYRRVQEGQTEAEVLDELAALRVRCPLLNEKDLCDLYGHRPITCRMYGIPTAIGGKGYTCGQSAFEPGKPYPTVNLDSIHTQLQQISAELLRDIKSHNIRLADLLVPLSMALLTDYDGVYLGVEAPPEEPRQPRRKRTKGRRHG